MYRNAKNNTDFINIFALSFLSSKIYVDNIKLFFGGDDNIITGHK